MKTGMIKWQKEFSSFIGIKSLIILEGNVHDIYPIFYQDERGLQIDDFLGMDDSLCNLIDESGVSAMNTVFYDPLYGFYTYDTDPKAAEDHLRSLFADYRYKAGKEINLHPCFHITGSNEEQKSGAASGHGDGFEQKWMGEIVRRAVTGGTEAGTADPANEPALYTFILNFASRMEDISLYKQDVSNMFLNLQAGAAQAVRSHGVRSTIILIVDKYNDVPTWVYLNNPDVHMITVTSPDMAMRRNMLGSVSAANLSRYAVFGDEENEAGRKLVAETEGCSLKELRDILELASRRDIPPERIGDAFRLYKYGVQDNPWEMLDDDIGDRIHNILHSRVKGQDKALSVVERVTTRAVQGLSGLTNANHEAKPRGILFFLGPTGTGKTETAKSLAEALFYDENACLRFDMSEYSLAHADQKLFGAPPGYVGYEGGGQLTNAVLAHPFSILLFDEIEKADSSIWYKFLQILEDGRLTDNKGRTVYFGETVIIFTSNIGMTKPKKAEGPFGDYERDKSGHIIMEPSIRIEDPYTEDTPEFCEQTEKQLKNAVKDYFQTVGPEVLNRIGEENIVAFNFVTVEAAKVICRAKLKSMCQAVLDEKGIILDISEAEEFFLHKAIGVRANGGRGVGNMLEKEFLNPLAAALAENRGKGITSLKAKVLEDEQRVVFV